MNNDLISREVLKETINSSIAEATEAGMVVNADYLWELLNYAIDNAPTVAVNCKDCDGYEAGYSAGLKDAERPQGEWIDYSDEGYIECPFCGQATTCEDNIDELHYCWNCGAKMKGGKE